MLRRTAAASLALILAVPCASQQGPSRSPALYSEQTLLDCAGARSAKELTREHLMEQVEAVEIPESFPLTLPLESYHSLECAAVVTLHAMEHADRLGLGRRDRLSLYLAGGHLGSVGRAAFNAITDGYNRIAPILATADPEYAMQAYEAGQRVPALLEAAWEQRLAFRPTGGR